MARKGKNKTGTRNKKRSPEQLEKIFEKEAQGNRDRKTSSVSARVALEQMLEHGFTVVSNDKDTQELSRKQREAMAWIASQHGIHNAQISLSGYSLFLKHPRLAKPVMLPYKDMLSFETLDTIKRLTGVLLMPAQAAAHQKSWRFAHA